MMVLCSGLRTPGLLSDATTVPVNVCVCVCGHVAIITAELVVQFFNVNKIANKRLLYIERQSLG